MLSIEEIALGAVSMINLAIGCTVLMRNPRHAVHVTFFIFVAGISAWIASFALLFYTGDFAWDKAVLAGSFVMFTSMIFFARAFPTERTLPLRLSWFVVPFLIALACLPFNLFIEGIRIDESGIIVPLLGPLFPLLALLILSYYGIAAYYFIANFRRAHEAARVKMAYLLAGVMLFMACVLLFDVALPLLGIYQLNLLGPASSLAFVSLTAWAIVRHQLMDIRIIVQRGIVYSALLSLIVLVYLACLTTFGLIFGSETDTPILLGAGLTTVLGIATVPIIERIFRRATDRFFFKGTYDYADALDTLSGIVEAHLELAELVAAAEASLAGILRAAYVRIRLDGGAEPPEAALLEPLMREGSAIGAIVVGPKRSGDHYTARDRTLLRTFARQAATAFERARLYEEVSRHAVTLRETVDARTRELRESQEHQRQLMIEVSHNLQTPLAIVQTRIDHLKRQAGYGGELQSFEQSLTSLSHFIYDLLALASLDGAPDESDRERVDLSALARDISEEIGTIAATRGIAVEADIVPGLHVSGNPKLLREAFMNIASNSVKYMGPHGEKRIRIALAQEDGRITLAIIDTGIGIAPEEKRRVFERFYRGRETAHGIRGTGLGLALAKRIVEQHGGTIELTSELKHGTTFRLSFPAAR